MNKQFLTELAIDELIVKYHNMAVTYLENGNKQLAFLAKQVEKDLLALRK